MLHFALTAIISVLFVVDPPGVLPAYLVITAEDDEAKRRHTAWKAALVATAVLTVFAAAGSTLFAFLGLTMPAFQIAGGLILFLIAVDMIHAQRHTQEGSPEVAEGIEKPDVAVTPLAIPMLAGPGAISTVITMVHRAAGSPAELGMIYLAILVTGIIIYLTLRLAEPIHKILGKTGIRILSRILGLILAGIAVQFVLDGLKAAELFLHSSR